MIFESISRGKVVSRCLVPPAQEKRDETELVTEQNLSLRNGERSSEERKKGRKELKDAGEFAREIELTRQMRL